MTTEWLVDQSGQCLPLLPKVLPADQRPYRLYRFLTDVEDILATIAGPTQRLQQITPLVQRLLASSSWLQVMPIAPNPETGWEVVTLYDEPMFPLTVQMVAWAPGTLSPIHNHGCWGLVALISGQEENQFWQRSGTADFPDRIESVGQQVFQPGEIITFLPEAIHQVQALGNQPTISFNLYGETNYEQRFEFDPVNHQASLF
jgi:predicted metal-dependent enzyme (double-stranded beta helix superfamily)